MRRYLPYRFRDVTSADILHLDLTQSPHRTYPATQAHIYKYIRTHSLGHEITVSTQLFSSCPSVRRAMSFLSPSYRYIWSVINKRWAKCKIGNLESQPHWKRTRLCRISFIQDYGEFNSSQQQLASYTTSGT